MSHDRIRDAVGREHWRFDSRRPDDDGTRFVQGRTEDFQETVSRGNEQLSKYRRLHSFIEASRNFSRPGVTIVPG